MIIGIKVILKQLENYKVLERAFATYPNYHLTLTGKNVIPSSAYNCMFSNEVTCVRRS